MNVLIACEESQRSCSAFRKRGHNAFSCDVQECSGGHPEWHIQQDVIPLLDGNCDFATIDGKSHHIEKWDLIIAHPPCTYLSSVGNRWFSVERYGQKALDRMKDREKAVEFFMAFINANCDKIAVENPVGIMSTRYRKPDQIIQPWMFGDPYEKKTCLWLKGLPLLKETNPVEPEPRKVYANGKTMPKWFDDCRFLPADERSKIRSKTFPGIANAFASQWG